MRRFYETNFDAVAGPRYEYPRKQFMSALTERLRADGYLVLDGPRRTGDGYYESAIADPDGNRIEITA